MYTHFGKTNNGAFEHPDLLDRGKWLPGWIFFPFPPSLDWKNGFMVGQAEPRHFVALSEDEVCVSVGARREWWLSSSPAPYSYFVRRALTM